MRTIVILLSMLFAMSTLSIGQEKLEVEGAITIENSSSETPALGTIRFNSSTNDFEGWNGTVWKSLTIPAVTVGSGMVTDIDGNTYQTVTIGTQTWMRENLRTTRYQDGTVIPERTLNADWAAATIPAWCWYENNQSYDLVYGKLYNWYAVDDSKGLCPSGWHVPSDGEWTELIVHLDPTAVVIWGFQSSIAGGKMKESGLAHWNPDNTGATNESGFTGFPGGTRHYSGIFEKIGDVGDWWSSTVSDSKAWLRNLEYDYGRVGRYDVNQVYGFSVRCIRDPD